MIVVYVLLLIASQVALYLVALAIGLEWKGRRQIDPEARFDVAVVLGCRVKPDGHATLTLARRAEAGARLVLAGKARRLVLSGGAVGHPTTEASAAFVHAVASGLSPDLIDREERSTTTEENAREVAAMLGDRERSVLVVTDAYHVPRSVRLFRKHFTKVAGHGVPDASVSRVKNALREACVIVVYLARGRLD
ncbi:MAG: YdcF family protein [Deltaproteobacteria bacterium]|nr:YdcF family protein [Deltaproteobacteria bacterium]